MSFTTTIIPALSFSAQLNPPTKRKALAEETSDFKSAMSPSKRRKTCPLHTEISATQARFAMSNQKKRIAGLEGHQAHLRNQCRRLEQDFQAFRSLAARESAKLRADLQSISNSAQIFEAQRQIAVARQQALEAENAQKDQEVAQLKRLLQQEQEKAAHLQEAQQEVSAEASAASIQRDNAVARQGQLETENAQQRQQLESVKKQLSQSQEKLANLRDSQPAFAYPSPPPSPRPSAQGHRKHSRPSAGKAAGATSPAGISRPARSGGRRSSSSLSPEALSKLKATSQSGWNEWHSNKLADSISNIDFAAQGMSSSTNQQETEANQSVAQENSEEQAETMETASQDYAARPSSISLPKGGLSPLHSMQALGDDEEL